MADDLQAIVQRMIDAGESEGNIASVIQHFRAQTPRSVSVVPASEPDTYLGGFMRSLGQTAKDTGKGIIEGVGNAFNVPAMLRTKQAEEQRIADEATGKREPTHDYGMGQLKATGQALMTPEGGGQAIGGLATSLALPRIITKAGPPLQEGAVSAYERMLKANKSTLEGMPKFGRSLADR